MLHTDRLRGLIVLGESLLIFVPLIVLGAAIGWPASLDDPAEIALPRLLDNEVAVRVGYLTYLAYSVLFLPVAVVAGEWLTAGSSRSTALRVAVGMAVASAALRAIGIVRWLSTMFPLAERWEEASSDTVRDALAVQFETVNDFGGAIGENLGVSLFAAGWLVATTIAARGARPRWILIVTAVVAGLLALPLIELAGVDSGPAVTISSTAINLWLLATGVAMLRAKPGR